MEQQPEQNETGKHMLTVGLVGLMGLAGLLLLFYETSLTGQATVTQLNVNRQSIAGCNAGEILLNARGLDALRQAGKARDPDFSLSRDARVNYNGIGYCADADVARSLLG